MATIERTTTKLVKVCDRCGNSRRIGMYTVIEHEHPAGVRTPYEVCAKCTAAFERWIKLAARRTGVEAGE